MGELKGARRPLAAAYRPYPAPSQIQDAEPMKADGGDMYIKRPEVLASSYLFEASNLVAAFEVSAARISRYFTDF
ncbi:hypothetical protein [Neorhizobium sp. T6_25]|uniref:hypothetical protein n=1 Tax=Neorhizobium sp. T6_25 TaxID=2093833 RepID=UPI00155F4FB8|nr:hypothetical protein [Neorhizobium sp. T6_25]